MSKEEVRERFKKTIEMLEGYKANSEYDPAYLEKLIVELKAKLRNPSWRYGDPELSDPNAGS